MDVMLFPKRGKPCELCGQVAQLKPYGPNGEWICPQCAMKDGKNSCAKCAIYKKALERIYYSTEQTGVWAMEIAEKALKEVGQ